MVWVLGLGDHLGQLKAILCRNNKDDIDDISQVILAQRREETLKFHQPACSLSNAKGEGK